jgi:hypothetical protein
MDRIEARCSCILLILCIDVPTLGFSAWDFSAVMAPFQLGAKYVRVAFEFSPL